ncbi:MAG: 30S ribosomal protein S16 [Phycisphaerales bacterium]|nr:MAG: 30S ribosomal protein S16 [Phycisphaerales bacterium]
MAVRLRLSRGGRTHRPFYRLNAVDGRRPRDTKVIEQLGTYDPICADPQKQVVLNRERIEYWLSVGAQPSDTVRSLLTRQGIAAAGGK